MKVLFIFYIASGGVETLNRLRCASLPQVGIEAHTLYLLPGGNGPEPDSCPYPVFFGSDDALLSDLLARQQYNAIIVTSDYRMTERLRRLGYGGILIYEAQGFGAPADAEVAVQLAVPYVQAYCNALLFPPTYHLFDLFNRYLPGVHRYVIANMLDVERFRYVPGERPRDPVLAWVGRLEPNKNWRELLAVASALRSRVPDLHLWMFHDPKLAADGENERFRQALAESGMGDRLAEFIRIPNSGMPHYYSRVADSGGFLLSTSVMEGFGYAVAEAILCGCPVLSTDSDGVRSFIEHDCTGKFYPLGDIQTAVAQGTDLIANGGLRERIAREGPARLAAGFHPARYANSFREMMNSFGIFT
ncbi:glycosyltransferase [Paenibacillus spiritus]|uniref:Glycosyltransferase n=1 Tax=Paenibacillus spiritus TaxID=2496557 RepID=A0A5J5G0R0_9BACL|nr:glycosyltransferase [Paenibacillus spiritus]KAA9000327.1 glycosyltransferase [Paenibacillus spiritus]